MIYFWNLLGFLGLWALFLSPVPVVVGGVRGAMHKPSERWLYIALAMFAGGLFATLLAVMMVS